MHIELAAVLNCYVISGLAPLPAVFGHNQAPLPVQCGSNPAPLPVISGHNLAPLFLHELFNFFYLFEAELGLSWSFGFILGVSEFPCLLHRKFVDHSRAPLMLKLLL